MSSFWSESSSALYIWAFIFEVSNLVLAQLQYLATVLEKSFQKHFIRIWYLAHGHSLFNPLYSNGFSHADNCNKVGIVHYIFLCPQL